MRQRIETRELKSSNSLRYNASGIVIPSTRLRGIRGNPRNSLFHNSKREQQRMKIIPQKIPRTQKETPTPKKVEVFVQPVVTPKALPNVPEKKEVKTIVVRKIPLPVHVKKVSKIVEKSMVEKESVVTPSVPVENCSTKQNSHIRSHDFDLSKFGNLRPVSSLKKADNQKNIGLVVDEVKSVYPEIVLDDKNIDQSALNCLLIDKIRELEKCIENMKTK